MKSCLCIATSLDLISVELVKNNKALSSYNNTFNFFSFYYFLLYISSISFLTWHKLYTKEPYF
jgi:hypothetical protein